MELTEINIKELILQAVNQPVIFSIKDYSYKITLVKEDKYDNTILSIVNNLLLNKVDIHSFIKSKTIMNTAKNNKDMYILGHKPNKPREHIIDNYYLFKIEYLHKKLNTSFGC